MSRIAGWVVHPVSSCFVYVPSRAVSGIRFSVVIILISEMSFFRVVDKLFF